MNHPGGCHCGNLQVEFASEIDPALIEVRACQCAFCRKHNSRAIADPAGHLAVVIGNRNELNRYTFGLRTAEYLVCRVCGVYAAAVTTGDDEPRAIAILNCLDGQDQFSRTPIAMSYDGETPDARIARRQQRWMPVTISLRQPVAR